MKTISLFRDKSQVRLCFKRTDKSVNVLDESCLSDLEACIKSLESDPPRLLILESAMVGCFIAGADLNLIAAITHADDASRLAERGQKLCRRIEVLSSISIALVQGSCMGGGLEVALACDYIVAVKGKRTLLALPEIKIGIHPGFGGCIRLPKRVGWIAAVEMILSGRPVSAEKAKRMGLADLCCEPEQNEAAVKYLISKGKVTSRSFKPIWLKLWPARLIFFQQVEKKTLARLQGIDVEKAYPAIPATISLLQKIIVLPDSAALKLEAESLGRMVITPTCKNLIQVFHLGECLKKQSAVRRGREAVSGFNKTAVYGAGIMGGGIAWVAAKTMDVDLHDVASDALTRGLKGLQQHAKRRGEIDHQRLQRIRPVLDASGLTGANVVIEAVLEDIKVKRDLWSDVEELVSKDALLLSNTSSLSISEMQHQRTNAGRIAGLHFFNPAPKMPLVEVIAGEKTTSETLDASCALAVSWGKYPIIVADRPGFLINRCLMPYMVAALQLIEAGQKPEHVDGALKHFGMPMGALELMDRVGLDICHHVAKQLFEAFAKKRESSAGAKSSVGNKTACFALPAWFDRMVGDGLLGEKSAQGFFLYGQGKQGGLNPKLASYVASAKYVEHEFDAALTASTNVMAVDEIVVACLIPMLLEALACLAENIVKNPQHVDAAFVYGIGFPPFRGGLLHYFASCDEEPLKQKIVALGFCLPENMEVLDGFRY